MDAARFALVAVRVVATLALAGCATQAPPGATPARTDAGTASTAGNATFLADARTYCASSGGQVQQRQPTYNTNGDQSTWVALGEPVEVCLFTSSDASQSRIIVDLVSLYSTNPTLAALAYLAKVQPSTKGNPSANPASLLCSQLGGASGYGTSVSGGGLVQDDGSGDPSVMSPCTFADGSMIDDWGIAYYSAGTVRGADLAPLFRFSRTNLPPVFGTGG